MFLKHTEVYKQFTCNFKTKAPLKPENHHLKNSTGGISSCEFYGLRKSSGEERKIDKTTREEDISSQHSVMLDFRMRELKYCRRELEELLEHGKKSVPKK